MLMEHNPGVLISDSYTFTTGIMATYNSTAEPPVLDIASDDGVTSDILKVTPSGLGEPIVTRAELWSYYCKRRSHFPRSLQCQ